MILAERVLERRASRGKWPGWLPVLPLVAAIGLLLLASPGIAVAKQARLLSGSFGTAATTPANPYPLTASDSLGPPALAVDDSSGDVYVADPGNHRVEKFTAAGVFILTFGAEVNKTAMEEGRSGEANICPAIGHPADVCQPGVKGSSPGAFDTGELENGSLGVAVDNSSGASHGDVYVADFADGLVSKFDSSGHLVEGWGDNGVGEAPDGQLNGVPPDRFNGVEGVTVDPAGNLWVGDGKVPARVLEFTAAGTLVAERQPRAGSRVERVAADAEGNLYIGYFSGVDKYDSAGVWLGRVTKESQEGQQFFYRGFAVDPSSGDLYVVNNLFLRSTRIDRIASASCQLDFEVGCAAVESFGVFPEGSIQGLALDSAAPAKTVFASEPASGRVLAFSLVTVPGVVTTKASGFSATAATLNGTVEPSGAPLSECFFEWGEGGGPYMHKVACEPAAGSIPVDSSVHPVKAEVAGLVAGHTYHFRLAAANANDVNGLVDEPSVGSDLSFGPPSIESVSALEATSEGATLQVVVDPNNVDSHLHIEYGSEVGVYDHSIPVLDIGSAGSAQSFSEHIAGLAAHTVYHYRVVAENALGTTASGDQTFTTQSPGVFAMLDDRAWELVSPPNKQGSDLEPIGEQGVVEAAADGGALAYLASGPTEPDPQGNAMQMQVLAARGPNGWSSHDLAIPHEQETGSSIGQGFEYRFFSSDLSRSVVQPFGGFLPLSSDASESTAYLRNDFTPGESDQPCASSCYKPLVTAANVPLETEFGEVGKCDQVCGPLFVGASADASHVILTSQASLVEGAPKGSLYEWSAGTLVPVSVRPPKEGGGFVPASSFPVLASLDGGARGAVSGDGSRVVFTERSGSLHLYQSDLAVGETVRLDVVQGGDGTGLVSPQFQFASSDGSRVFFTDQQRLTAGSGAQAGQPDLYECRIVEEPGGLVCKLTDLTPKNGLGESADVQGNVLGAAEAGEGIYFVAEGVLAGNHNANGETAVPGNCTEGSETARCNLYLYRAGVTTFVATLDNGDGRDWFGVLQSLTARVSPSGDWLAFMSQRSLTGYDNRDAVSNEPDEEVFLYHAGGGVGEAGTLVCASCDPTGARPHGVEYRNLKNGLVGGDRVWPDTQWLAANVPGWTPYRLDTSLYQSRYLSDSGRLFFNSSDDLVPQDTNGTEDVYEYEPPGGGEGASPSDSCTVVSITYSSVSGGCVDLISSGTSPRESGFLDASESGNDVFFLTQAQLSARDVDTALDVYDARADGVEPEVARPVECQGDACQAFVAPPAQLTPGSLIYSGPGNTIPASPRTAGTVKRKAKQLTRAQKLVRALRACAKDRKRKRRALCERHAKNEYGPRSKTSSRKGGR